MVYASFNLYSANLQILITNQSLKKCEGMRKGGVNVFSYTKHLQAFHDPFLRQAIICLLEVYPRYMLVNLSLFCIFGDGFVDEKLINCTSYIFDTAFMFIWDDVLVILMFVNCKKTSIEKLPNVGQTSNWSVVAGVE